LGRLRYFGANLFPKDRDAVRASLPKLWLAPLEAENFKDLYETFIITAECDPMRDEGEAYGRKVVEAGSKVMFKQRETSQVSTGYVLTRTTGIWDSLIISNV